MQPDPTGPATVRLSLADALRIALAVNPGVAAANDQIPFAQARVREVRAAVNLQLSGTATYTRQGPIASFTLPGSNGMPPQTIRLGVPTSKAVVFAGRKPLDLSGQNRISRDIARKGITTAELDLARAQNDLLLAVYNAYYGVLRADRFVGVEQEAVADAEAQRRVADAQFRAGTVAQFDVLRAAVQVENSRQNLVTSQRDASLARAQLLNAIGIDPDTVVTLEDVSLPPPAAAPVSLPIVPSPGTPGAAPGGETPPSPGSTGAPATGGAPSAGEAPSTGVAPAPEGAVPGAATAATPIPPAASVSPQANLMAHPGAAAGGAGPSPSATPLTTGTGPRDTADLPLDLPTALSQAYDLRPEVRSAANAVRIAQRNIDLARRGRWPDVSINGTYALTPDVAGFAANKRSWTLDAELTVPIFEGGLTRARVQESRANLNSARATLEQARQSVGLDVRSALLNLQEASRRRETTAANVVQAREAVRIAQVRFQSGVSTTVEVIDAQVALTQAESNQVTADYDYLSAEAQLRKAIGRLIPTDTWTRVMAKPGPPPTAADMEGRVAGPTGRPAGPAGGDTGPG